MTAIGLRAFHQVNQCVSEHVSTAFWFVTFCAVLGAVLFVIMVGLRISDRRHARTQIRELKSLAEFAVMGGQMTRVWASEDLARLAQQ